MVLALLGYGTMKQGQLTALLESPSSAIQTPF